MNKITTEIRYKDMSFDFIKKVKGMKMYFNNDCSYAIIVNKDEEVLFEFDEKVLFELRYDFR